METSAIQKLEDLLLVAVPRDLMDDEVLYLRRQVVREIRKHHSRWVMLDFSAVDICDSFFGRFIQSTADMVGLMGANVIVSGLQDAVVETMVELGMVLPNIHAVLDLDDALTLSRATQRLQAPWAMEGNLDWDEDEDDGGQLTAESRRQNGHHFDEV
ncbi:MAG: STAS domain-containing protein [Anaerolineae bacterium]|nr:STAS domain-containing protein [Anaerolineae bacterium]